MRKTAKTHPIKLTVGLGVGHPLGLKKKEEIRNFRFKTKEEAERDLKALQHCGVVLFHTIK
jgi:hypothetical protein